MRALKDAVPPGHRASGGPVREQRAKRWGLAGLGLLACLALGGCWLPYALVSGCPKLSNPPSLMGFQISGAERRVERYPRPMRDAVFISVHETRKVRLQFRRYTWIQWCEELSEADLRAWLEKADILSREPRVQGRPEATEELFGVSLGPSEHKRAGLVALDELSEDGLEAVHELLCLGREAFGPRLTQETLAIAPDLTARLGFPDTCPPAPDGS